jgi:hypothetical protein
MADSHIGIVDAAEGLARNPLGIIALFIVLVYGFASLVTAFAGSSTHEKRLSSYGQYVNARGVNNMAIERKLQA